MILKPNTPVSLPLSQAFEMAPALKGVWNGMEEVRLRLGLNGEADSSVAGPVSELEPTALDGLLEGQQLTLPAVIIWLPPFAEGFLASILSSELNLHVATSRNWVTGTAVVCWEDPTAQLLLEQDELEESLLEAAKSKNLVLAVFCGDTFWLVRCVSTALNEHDMQGCSFTANNDKSWRKFSRAELDAFEAERQAFLKSDPALCRRWMPVILKRN